MSDIQDSYSSKLDLFQKPFVEQAVKDIYYVDFSPKTSYKKGSIVEFNIEPTSPDYIDLSKCRLKVKARILTESGSPIGEPNNVAFVNLSLHSLFRQVDLMLQDKLISSDTGINYPYKTLLDVLLHHNKGSKESKLQSEVPVNGKSVPQEALQPNFTTGDYMTYLTLFYDEYNPQEDNFIKRDDYNNGYSLFVFNVQGGDKELMPVQREGISRLALQFPQNTSDALTIICYALFPACLSCDISRNIWW